MILGLLIVAVAVGSVTRSWLVQDLMAGAALVALPIAIVNGEWGTALFAAVVVVGFAWHWGRLA